MVEQAIAIAVEQIRQEHEAIALGEQHQQLAEDGRESGALDELGHGRALPRGGHGRVQQHLFERRVLPEKVDEGGKMVVHDLKVDLLCDGDVEERAGVAIGGGFVGHRAGLFLIFTSARFYTIASGFPKPTGLCL